MTEAEIFCRLYQQACRATDEARAAEQAALAQARRAGCTLQQLADIRGLTRAGVAWLLKHDTRAPHLKHRNNL